MKPLDEMLPEERDPQYAELITFLQQADSKPVSVTPDRQAQILARVRERLRIPDSGEGGVSRDKIDLIAPFGVPPLKEVPRQHRLSRWVMLIAAVLVLGALVVTNLLIFQSRTPSTGTPTGTQPPLAPPIGPPGKPVTVHTQANGLEATMQVTSGPYFLSEMLKVELSFTIHSHDTFDLETYLAEKSCAPSFQGELPPVMMTGGGKPSDTDLQHNLADFGSGCGEPQMLSVLPNQTNSFSTYIVLTKSGRITLTAQLGVAILVYGQDNSYRRLNGDPLAGHWPSLHISVQAGIPSDRLITGQQRGTQVTIDAPSPARSQLVYAYILRCYATGEGSGSKLKATTLQQPQCPPYIYNNHPNSFVKWTYAVGAPGYAVVSGSVHK